VARQRDRVIFGFRHARALRPRSNVFLLQLSQLSHLSTYYGEPSLKWRPRSALRMLAKFCQ
jgi:hypothetical protein